MLQEQRPILAITMGDAAGCGPEIIVKALADKKIYRLCRPLVFGDVGRMALVAEIVKSPLKIRTTADAQNGLYEYGTIDILDFANVPTDLPFGQVDGRAGHAAYMYIEAAIQQALDKKVAAIVTASINKEALHLSLIHI